MPVSTQPSEQQILTELNEAIKLIERVGQINIVGILSELEKTILKPGEKPRDFGGEPPSIYREIEEYCNGQDALFQGMKTTDNKIGALNHLREIRDNYTHSC